MASFDETLNKADIEDNASPENKDTPTLPPIISASSGRTRQESVTFTGRSTSMEEPRVSFRSMTRMQKITLANLALMNLGSSICFSLLAPFFPSEAALKGANSTVTGLIFGVFEFVIFLSAPLFGILLPKIGAKKMYICGVFMCGTCAILFGFLDASPNGTVYITMCFVTRSIEALGAAQELTAAFAIVAHVFPDQVSTMFGILETFSGLGFTLGPVIGGALYEIGGFRLPFIVLGSVLLVLCLMSAIAFPNLDDSSNPRKASLLSALLIPEIAVVGIFTILLTSCLGFLDPTMEPRLKFIDTGITSLTVGLVFLSAGAVYTISAPIWGYLSDRTGVTKSFMLFGALTSTASFLVLGPAPFLPVNATVWLMIVSMVLMALGVGAGLMTTFAEMLQAAYRRNFPQNYETYGIISGLTNSFFSLGAFLGPTAGGALNDGLGFEWASTIIAALQLFAAFLVFVLIIVTYLNRQQTEPGQSTIADINATPQERSPLLA